MPRTRLYAIDRLERELSQLLQWREELVNQGVAHQPRLVQIDLHRLWLETQIAILNDPVEKAPA
ncbi:MAG: hypothetical protein AAFZ74_10420 [Pseudomonadota bacterium]